MPNALLDALKTVLLPGDISTTTVSDLPVDASPRYVVEQEIIPFRSVRSPLLTPIRDVQPVLRTPIKNFAPVRGRIRNIPSLPGQEGTRMMPYGDADMKATGFSGLTSTMNRSYGAVGTGLDSSYPAPIPIEESRVQRCLRNYSLPACASCCDQFQNPSKRKRCLNKCNAKFRPLPSDDGGIVSHTPLPPSNNPLLSNRSAFGQFVSPSEWIAAKWGQSAGSSAPMHPGSHQRSARRGTYQTKRGFFGLGYSPNLFMTSVASNPDAAAWWIKNMPDPSSGGGQQGQCKSWFQNPKANCETDMVKIGLIAAAVFLVMK